MKNTTNAASLAAWDQSARAKFTVKVSKSGTEYGDGEYLAGTTLEEARQEAEKFAQRFQTGRIVICQVFWPKSKPLEIVRAA